LPEDNNPKSISGRTINCIDQYDDTTLVIGTVNGGINFFNPDTKIFSNLSTQDGLPSNTIYAIKKDATGYTWFTTDYGLYKFKKQGDQFIRYNIDPGIINSSFKLSGFYRLKDERWVTSTSTEIICFDPGSRHPVNKPGTKVEIAGLKIFDTPFSVDSLLEENIPIHLSYKQNFLTVEFASLNFSNLQQTKYHYKLSGVNDDWVNADTKTFVSYTNLQPGEYTFSVKANNADVSAESNPITSFKIIIAPPFWKTWWFNTLIILLAVGFIYGLLKRRIKAVRHEAEMKQKIAETEMMALRAQMNPHFIFNCINSIDAMIQSNDKYQATVYLNKFAKLIRNILDSSKQNLVPLSKDIETLQLYIDLELFRNENKFTAEVFADPALLQDDYQVPPLIIQPYVENAILHGLRHRNDNKGKLNVVVQRENGVLKYEITDNGVGRNSKREQVQDAKKQKQAYGMQISNDRVRIFNKEEKASVEITDLEINGNPGGTKVTVQLKIQ
jgi:Histidine kinase/Y_Y_Y domain